MSCKLLTRKQVNQKYGLDYVAESYRRFERKGYLTAIRMGPLSRVHYAEDEVIRFFG